VTDAAARLSLVPVAAGLCLLAGDGLSIHAETVGYLAAGRCDACSPWHPLFVVAPVLVGTAAALGSGYVLVRR
jgi:hypothetical protein